MARILVIEDNPANLELVSYLLRAFGYEVLQARDGAEGLKALRTSVVDLVICDVQLPGMDGYEILDAIREDLKVTVPVIAVTALAMVGDRERVLSSGFQGYISKPINPPDFVLQIEGFLPSAGQQRTLPKS